MGSKVYFTKKIVEDPVRLFKQLNLLNMSRGTSKTVARLQAQVGQVERSVTSIVIPPSEAAGAVGLSQAVTPGVVSLVFAALADTNYTVDGFVLLADGTRGIIIPQIPPLTDTRTTTGVDVRVFDTGTLYAWLTPY